MSKSISVDTLDHHCYNPDDAEYIETHFQDEGEHSQQIIVPEDSLLLQVDEEGFGPELITGILTTQGYHPQILSTQHYNEHSGMRIETVRFLAHMNDIERELVLRGDCQDIPLTAQGFLERRFYNANVAALLRVAPLNSLEIQVIRDKKGLSAWYLEKVDAWARWMCKAGKGNTTQFCSYPGLGIMELLLYVTSTYVEYPMESIVYELDHYAELYGLVNPEEDEIAEATRMDDVITTITGKNDLDEEVSHYPEVISEREGIWASTIETDLQYVSPYPADKSLAEIGQCFVETKGTSLLVTDSATLELEPGAGMTQAEVDYCIEGLHPTSIMRVQDLTTMSAYTAADNAPAAYFFDGFWVFAHTGVSNRKRVVRQPDICSLCRDREVEMSARASMKSHTQHWRVCCPHQHVSKAHHNGLNWLFVHDKIDEATMLEYDVVVLPSTDSYLIPSLMYRKRGLEHLPLSGFMTAGSREMVRISLRPDASTILWTVDKMPMYYPHWTVTPAFRAFPQMGIHTSFNNEYRSLLPSRAWQCRLGNGLMVRPKGSTHWGRVSRLKDAYIYLMLWNADVGSIIMSMVLDVYCFQIRLWANVPPTGAWQYDEDSYAQMHGSGGVDEKDYDAWEVPPEEKPS